MARFEPGIRGYVRSMNGVYRAPLRSRRDDVDHALAVEWALRQKVVAVGGLLDPRPRSLVEAVERLADVDERTAWRLDRFAAVPRGAFVWTRHPDGDLWLGRIEGRWAYDDSAEATSLDLPHVRACHWSAHPAPLSEVPDAVLATFERGGRNFQQTHGQDVEQQTWELWTELAA